MRRTAAGDLAHQQKAPVWAKKGAFSLMFTVWIVAHLLTETKTRLNNSAEHHSNARPLLPAPGSRLSPGRTRVLHIDPFPILEEIDVGHRNSIQDTMIALDSELPHDAFASLIEQETLRPFDKLRVTCEGAVS